MRRNIIKYLLVLLLLLGSNLAAMAQYNPDPPAEPGNPEAAMSYKVTLVNGTDGAGTLLGAGKYKCGTTVNVKATANTNYKFLYWTKNDSDEPYSTNTSFTYIVTQENVTFKAIYETAKSVTVRLADTAAGTVSGNGILFAGGKTTVSTNGNQYYEFQYWLKNDETTPYSSTPSFVYTMGDEDVVFTAVYNYNKPEYNPELPDEPGEASKLASYNVKVQLNNHEAGVVSGEGKFKYGKSVIISTSANAGYEFVRWLKGEEEYSTAMSFDYTVTDEDVVFTAEYEYVGIPEPTPTSHKLFLESSPAGSCTFSMASGTDIGIDDMYSVTIIPGTDQEFIGWYKKGVKVSANLTYSTYMGNEDVTLVAKFKYNPSNPDEPSGSSSDLDRLGDVNHDGMVNMIDAILVMNKYLRKPAELDEVFADVNYDEKITMADANEIVNMYLALVAEPSLNETSDNTSIENGLYVTEATCVKGENTTLIVNMKNSAGVQTVGCDIYLPEGFDFEKNTEGEAAGVLLSDVRTNKTESAYHVLGSAIQADGALRVGILQQTGKEFEGNDGEIFRISVAVPEEFQEGDYLVKISNQEFSFLGGSNNPSETYSKITVVSPTGINDIRNSGAKATYVKKIIKDRRVVVIKGKKTFTTVGTEIK